MENPLRKCNKCVPMVHSFQKDGTLRMGVILKYFKQRKGSSFEKYSEDLAEPWADGSWLINNAPAIRRFVPREVISHPLTTIVFDENNYPTTTEVVVSNNKKFTDVVAALKGKTAWFVPWDFPIPDPVDNPMHPDYFMKIKSMEYIRMPINKLPEMFGWVQIVPNQYFKEELLAKSNSHK